MPFAAFTTKVSPLLGCTVRLEKGLFALLNLKKITNFIAVFTIAEERGNFLYFHLRLFFSFWPIKRDRTLLGFGFKLDILNVFYARK